MNSEERFTEKLIGKIPGYLVAATSGLTEGSRYKEFDYANALECITWNYAQCGIQAPVLVVTENPVEMQLMFNFIQSRFLKYTKIRDNRSRIFESCLSAQLEELATVIPESWIHGIINTHQINRVQPDLTVSFSAHLDDQLFNRLYKPLFSELEKDLDPVLGARLGSLLREPLRRLLGEQLGEANDDFVAKELRRYPGLFSRLIASYLFTVNLYSDCIYYWYEFLRKESGRDLTVTDLFQRTFEVQRHSGLSQAIFSRDLCVASKYPMEVYWNEDFELSNTKGYALVWGAFSDLTNMNAYYLDGEFVDAHTFKHLTKNMDNARRTNPGLRA